jgi:ClpP class serine protease
MNFELAREVYGIGVWSVDSKTLPAMLQIISNSKNGQSLELPKVKYNSVSILDAKSDDCDDYEECEDYEPTNEDIQGIAVINLDGAITVGGGMSSCGMTELSESMLELSKNENIKGFLIYTNSGGGSSMAVEIMTDAISEIRKTKPVFGLIKKGGMAASAAYGILSACEFIYAESEMSTVGSCGTMVQFEGREANTTDGEGEKHIRLYATKSIKKNEGFEQALNKDNYTLIVNDMLNPINERFLSLIENNRPVLKGTDFNDGHDEFAKDSIGKFVDGISTKQEVIKNILSKTKVVSINSNLIKMNKSEIKSAHPEVYSDILAEGVTAEKDRVASWMAYNEADPKAVAAGIESGLEITQAESHAFLVKLASQNKLNNLVLDNAKPLVTEPTATQVVEKTAEQEEIENAFNFKI